MFLRLNWLLPPLLDLKFSSHLTTLCKPCFKRSQKTAATTFEIYQNYVDKACFLYRRSQLSFTTQIVCLHVISDSYGSSDLELRPRQILINTFLLSSHLRFSTSHTHRSPLKFLFRNLKYPYDRRFRKFWVSSYYKVKTRYRTIRGRMSSTKIGKQFSTVSKTLLYSTHLRLLSNSSVVVLLLQ